MKKRLIVLLFLVLLLGVGALVLLGQRRENDARLLYSGTIEARQADLAFQVTGRVSIVAVDEGARVQAGQILAELDPVEFQTRRDQAAANLTRATESAAQLEALLALYQETLPAEVERAQAAVQVLQANFEEVETGSRAQEVERARLAVEAARVTLEQAVRDRRRYERLSSQGIVSESEKEAAELRHDTATKEFERAREALGLLKEGSRQESVAAARARLAEGRAALRQARGQLGRIEVTRRELGAAGALVRAAEAELRLAETHLRYTRLTAPSGGIVTSRNVEPGEVVTPSREVISLADLATVDLKVFVEETRIGRIRPGQEVEVTTDSFPAKRHLGRVTFISPEGEFTPKIIQTHKERVKLVYLVKIAVPNPDLELKPGMPADAWFR